MENTTQKGFKKSNRYGSKVQLYICENGDIAYYIRYRHPTTKKSTRKKIGRKSEGITEAIAHKVYVDTLQSLRAKQHNFKKILPKKATFDDLASAFIDYQKLHSKSYKATEGNYKKHLKPYLGDVSLQDDMDSILLSIKKRLLDSGYSKSTINQIIKLALRIDNFGNTRGYLAHRLFDDRKLLKEEAKRLRYLTKKEIQHLFLMGENEPQWVQTFIYLALHTGARAGAILELKVRDIDFDTRTISLLDAKSRERYSIPLYPELYHFLKKNMFRPSREGYLVHAKGKPVKYGTLQSRISNLLKEFNKNVDKSNKAVIHTFRHTFASHLALNGVPIPQIQKLLNHKNIEQTMIYAHLADDKISDYEAIEKLYK